MPVISQNEPEPYASVYYIPQNGGLYIPTEKNLRKIVETAVSSRLEKKDAYPTSILKLALEGAGIYQDFSGSVIDDLVERGIVKKSRFNKQPYIFRPMFDTIRDTEDVRHQAERLDAFMKVQKDRRKSGSMAELVVYVALCKAYLELRENIVIRLLPRKQYPELNNTDWEVDAQLIIRGENFPIDVSNSIQHIMTDYGKVQRAQEVHEGGLANPVLVNRMSSKDVKRRYSMWNGGVCDLTHLILLDDQEIDCREVTRDFGVDKQIHWVPPLRIAGEEWDGRVYDMKIRERVDGRLSTTYEDFAAASDQIPEEVLTKIRGLVRSLYIGTEYRQAESEDERLLALLLQSAYAYLLRCRGWVELEEPYEYASKTLRGGRRVAFYKREDEFKDRIAQKFEFLKTCGFLRRRKSRYVVDDAVHPMQFL